MRKRNDIAMRALLAWTKRRYTSVAEETSLKRAVLYVPAHDQRKVEKAAQEIDVDVVCLDCEDAVVEGRKEEARHKASENLQKLNFGRSEVAVRLNAVSTGLCGRDIREVFSNRVLPDIVILPKVESLDDIKYFKSRMESVLQLRDDKNRNATGKKGGKLQLMTKCESAKGLVQLGSILEKAKEASNLLELTGCMFGGYDYATDVHAIRTDHATELLFARQNFVAQCRAHRVAPIDMICIDFKDLNRVKREAIEARQFGFSGKQIIHPSSVEPVQNAFLPTTKEVEEAKELVRLFEEKQAEGIGAFLYKGIMVDLPMLYQARAVLALSKHAHT